MNFLKKIEKLLGINDNKKKKKKETAKPKSTPLKRNVVKTSSKTTPLNRTTTTKSTPLKRNTTITRSNPLINQSENKYVKPTTTKSDKNTKVKSTPLNYEKAHKEYVEREKQKKELIKFRDESSKKIQDIQAKRKPLQEKSAKRTIELQSKNSKLMEKPKTTSKDISNSLINDAKNKKPAKSEYEKQRENYRNVNNDKQLKTLIKQEKKLKRKQDEQQYNKDFAEVYLEDSKNYDKASERVLKRGIAGTTSALENLFKDSYYPGKATIRGGRARENAKSGLEKTAGNVAEGVGGMLPSYAFSAITTPAGGNVLMGLQAGSGSYKEAKTKNKSDKQAVAYGVAIGTLESALGKVLGGISGVYGKGFVSGKLAESIPQKVTSNPAVQKLVAQVVNSGGEFTEEYLQEYLQPIVANLLLDEKNKVKFFSKENLEAGIAGGLTSAVMNTPSYVINNPNINIDTKNNVKNTNNKTNTKVEQITINNLIEKINQNKKEINNKIQEAMTLNQNKTLNTTETQRQRINDAIDIKTGEIMALKQQNRTIQAELDNNTNFRNVNLSEQENNNQVLNNNIKQKQLEIIQETNPMNNEYNTGIRNVEDIKTFNEAYDNAKIEAQEDGYSQYSAYPDITNELLDNAKETGKIKVYSSYPIENGVFVTPSLMQATDYAGGNVDNVYSETVDLNDVAWINVDEGQYAKVDNMSNLMYNEDVAIPQGSLINEYNEKLSKQEWREYFKKIDNNGIEYQYGNNEKSVMKINDKIILSTYIDSKPQVVSMWNINELLADSYNMTVDDIANTIISVAERTGYDETRIRDIINNFNGEKILSDNNITGNNVANDSKESKNIYNETNRGGEENNNGKNVFQPNGKIDSTNLEELDSSFSNEEVNKLAKELDELDPEVMAQAFLEKEGDRLKDVAKESGYNLTDKQIIQLYNQNVSKTNIGTLKRIVLEAMENRNYEIDRIAKITKNKNIKILGDHINNMQGEIETNLNTAQIDGEGNVIGESLSDIFAPYTKAKEDVAFNDYLFHRSNIERHKNGVGSQVPMEDSQQLVKAYEEKYPTFKKGAEKVNNYNRNLLKRQVESGLISQDTADNITSKYEFYVPFYENQYLDDNYVPSDKVELKSGNTLRRAQGGADANLLLFQDAMAKQTQQAISNINKNELYKEIVNTLPKKAIDVMENVNPDEFNALVKESKKHYLTAFENGTPVQVEISQELFNELNKTFENQLKSGEHAMRVVWKPIQKLNDIKRNLVTTWSPSFVVTNALKDIQDAYLNTKYTKDFAKAYPTAIKEMVTGKDTSGNLQKFLNMYGKPNIMGDYSLEGVDADVSNLMKNGKVNNSALVKLAKKIPQINEVIEMIPRYTEYLASLENGCSQKEALYNAREVTVNFGRGGYFAKALNRNGMTFFNAQIQGFSKFFRNFHDAPVRTTAKATAYGLTVALINQLMHGDDDDYDLLPDYIKDNYYLFKVSSNEELKAMPKDMKEKYLIKKGKATFIRIPRGRMLSIFSSMINRGKDRAQGKRGELTLAEDIKSWFGNATNQVGLPDVGSSYLFAPISQAKKNKTWYGGQLVPDRLLKKDGDEVPAEQQYDASTDKLSIWLGQKTGISPYKINYILDQYTGGIGDMLMPLIIEEAQSSSNGTLGMALAPLKDKFTADTINDNKNVTNFYSKAEKLGTKSLKEDATGLDKLKSGYMKNVSYKMGALYKQIRDVQADKNLSKKEKYERYEVLKAQINELAKNELENVNKVKGDEYYGEVEENGKTKQLFRSAKGNYYELYDNQKEALDKANLTVKERNNLYKTKDEITNYLKNSNDSNKYSKRYAIIKNSNNSQSAKAILYNQNKQFYQKDPTPLVKSKLVDHFLEIESQNIKSDYKNGKIVYNSKRNKIAKAIEKLNATAEQKQKLFEFYYPNAKKGSSSGGKRTKGTSGSKKRTGGTRAKSRVKAPTIKSTKITPVKLSKNVTPIKKSTSTSNNNKLYQDALKNLLFKTKKRG